MKYATAMKVLATMRQGVIRSDDACKLAGAARVLMFRDGTVWALDPVASGLSHHGTPTDDDLIARDWVYDKDPTGLAEDHEWLSLLPEDVKREGLKAAVDFERRQRAIEKDNAHTAKLAEDAKSSEAA